MKKFLNLVKPYADIILGVFIVMRYMYLLEDPSLLGFGIVALIFGTYCIVAGILQTVLKSKINELANRILDLITIAVLPLLVFVRNISLLAAIASQFAVLGWIMVIVGMASAISLIVMMSITKFTDSKGIETILKLVCTIFGVVLVSELLFELVSGAPLSIGDVTMAEIIIYGIYLFLLFNEVKSIQTKNEEAEETKYETTIEE